MEISSSNSQTPTLPRNFTRFTLETKCKILSHLSAIGGNISQCARNVGLERRPIGKWHRQKEDIFRSTHKRVSFRVNNKRKYAHWPELEQRLNEWIIEKRNIMFYNIMKSRNIMKYHGCEC